MRRPFLLAATFSFFAVACCASVLALDPTLDISQYAHTSWKVRDGFPKGAVFSIAQTPDGYLWIGTEFGLFRFDGVRAVPWQSADGQRLPGNFINVLLTARDGTLWIGTRGGLASWNHGHLHQYPELAGAVVFAVIEDHDGAVWVGSGSAPGRSLCAIKSEKMQCFGAASLGQAVTALYEDRERNLWVWGQDSGLWRWVPAPQRYFGSPHEHARVNAILEDDSGTLLLGTDGGVIELVNEMFKPYPVPQNGVPAIPVRLIRSRDGSIWIGSTRGLLHVHDKRIDEFRAIDGLSADFVASIFEDREGNIWVGTQDGLDRFHDVAVPTISEKQGLSNTAAWSVQAAPDGSIWIGTAEGLNCWKDGHITFFASPRARTSNPGANESKQSRDGSRAIGSVRAGAKTGLTGAIESLGVDSEGQPIVSTSEGVFLKNGSRFARIPGIPGGTYLLVFGDKSGNVWISNFERGLFRWNKAEGVETISPEQLGGRRVNSMLPDELRGGIWIGFFEGGVAYIKDHKILASYSVRDDLGSGNVPQLRSDSSGALWAATEGGLSRIRDGRITTLTTRNGLPCDAVLWSMEDNDHAVWLEMPCGVVRVFKSEMDHWVRDPNYVVLSTIFDTNDGARTSGIPGGYPPIVTMSPDGRIWYLPRDGVSVIDPHHLAFNATQPPIRIEQINADRKTYWQNLFGDASSSHPNLPPLVRDLEIDYTALSLVAPEKNLFRYKLEGFDRDWHDVGNRRQAFYTNLPPRTYRFRVIACNNSGVWNETGDSFEFSIAPAYYQTLWFKLLCAVVFLAMLWALYQRRLHIIRQQYAAGLEATVGERMRVARELHDTLLQSFQGVAFQLQAARKLLIRKADNAEQVLDEAIVATEQALQEGRSAIRDLRPEPAAQRDLPELLNAVGNEMATADELHGSAPAYRVVVEGKQQELSTMLQDEVYRIAREVIRNAFVHAAASHIEVEIRYDQDQLRLRVRDDGKGIDPKVLAGGQSGHFGIPGMRERAQRIGARLDFWSEMGAGTEVELAVPASMAYQKRRDGRRFRLFNLAGGNRAGRDDQRT
jgi:signal transduction histidine kinase/ligand-binding sensor domain-containing protein